ncbi:MAG TPA: hypothetical protein ENF47_05310 [Thermoprotei archaeon]|nr:hypothetical protein [Thermoprotei archaeon]
MNGNILDMDGGPGIIYSMLSGDIYYINLDIDFSLFSIADKDFDRIYASPEDKVFRSEVFDAVIIHESLHHSTTN